MSYPSRKSYPRVTMMNLDPTAQRKKARSISAKGLAKHATMGTRPRMTRMLYVYPTARIISENY
jgi:hypothetical protein